MPGHTTDDNIADRFWAKVRKTSGCWQWIGAKNNRGKGVMRIDDKLYKASRIAWKVQFGPIPDGQQVLHHCDNQECMKGKHLFLGTNMDNVLDCMSKKRHGLGSRNGRAVLNERKVKTIRRLYATGISTRALVIRFNSSKSRVRAAIRGTNWGHV